MIVAIKAFVSSVYALLPFGRPRATKIPEREQEHQPGVTCTLSVPNASAVAAESLLPANHETAALERARETPNPDRIKLRPGAWYSG